MECASLILLTLTLLLTGAAQVTDAQEYESCAFENRNDVWLGMIESPVYKTSNNITSYPPNQNCSWTITFPYPYVNRVQLNASIMELYQTGIGCDPDWMRYSYPGQPVGIHLWCDINHMDNPVTFNNTNQVILQFHSDNISDYVNDGAGKGRGFKIQYRALCDEDHMFEVENLATPLSPPPRNSPLVDCKYKWRIKDPPDTAEDQFLLLKAIPSTNEWKIQELPLPDLGICLPYRNVTVNYSPSLGGQPPDSRLSLQRATEEECGCLLRSKNCQNDGVCTPTLGTFICECKPSFTGQKCESTINFSSSTVTMSSSTSSMSSTTVTHHDGKHCAKGVDSYSESGIYWSRTKMGDTDQQPCPNATGNATRPCLIVDSVASWGQPDLSGCVSKLFSDLFNAAKLLSHAVDIDQNAIVNLTSALTSATTMTTGKKMFAGDLNAATSTLQTVVGIVAKTVADNDGLSDIAKGFGNAVGNIVDPKTAAVWRFTHKDYLESRITSLLESMESLSANIATKASEIISRKRRSVTTYSSYLPQNISVSSQNVEYEVKLIDREHSLGPLVFSGHTAVSEIILPDIVFKRAVQRSSDTFIHIYNAKFTSISKLIDRTKKMSDTTDNISAPVVNSDILSSKVLNVNKQTFTALTHPVKLVFRLQNSRLSKRFQQQCVFLNMTATTAANRWLKQGCWRSKSESNESATVCYCNHLTNFAVLMDIYGIEESIDELNSKILTYLSYAGGALSVIGCVLSIIVFEFFRLKNERIRIHEQLAVTIILAQAFFLVGIDRTENRSVCMAMAICLHYFLIAMFCWMLVEGVHLYLMLVKVFQSGSHMKKYIAIGWGIPIVLVGISAGIFHDDYGAGSICWLTREVLLVAFVPAVGLVIVINTVVLLIVMKIMLTSLSKGSKANSEDRSSVRIGLKAAAVLLPLLGLTWTFGFLSITSKETLIFTYLFTLFNSMQGVFFFVFHCLLSVDVQNAYDRRSRRLSHLRMTESSISKLHSRKSSETGDLSKHSTLMSEIASTLERRRSHRNSYSSIGRPQSVTFDDDVFLTQDGPTTRNSIHSNRSSVYSNRSFHDIVRSPPVSSLEKVEGYRHNVFNHSTRSTGSVSSDGYQFYYGKDKKTVNETTLYDYDKNNVYATVNK